jgi:hypothetical protein
MDEDLAIVIQTCDKYELFWEGWYHSFNEFWDFNLPYKIYFCNEVIDLPFKHEKIIQLKTGENEFSDRLLFILDKIKENNLLYLQEDIWMIKPIDIQSYYYDFVKYDFDALRLLRNHNTFYCVTSNVEGENYIQLDNTRSRFLVSHHPGFWKREFYKKCMCKGENPWSNEINATNRIRTLEPRIFTLLKSVKWYFEVVKCGYLKKYGRDILKKYNILSNFPEGRINLKN